MNIWKIFTQKGCNFKAIKKKLSSVINSNEFRQYVTS